MSARAGIQLVTAICAAACASTGEPRCQGATRPAIQDTLYFGTATARGPVADGEFEAFVAGTVTPRFAQGLTTWSASGQWRGNDGRIVHEPSHVLLLVHGDDADSEQAVLEIISAYKRQFHQEAVLRVKTAGCASV